MDNHILTCLPGKYETVRRFNRTPLLPNLYLTPTHPQETSIPPVQKYISCTFSRLVRI